MDIRYTDFATLFHNNHTHFSKDIVRSLYDKWASTYDKHADDFQLGGPRKCGGIVNQLHSDKNTSILDFGAGTGLVGVQLKQRGFTNIVALDMSRKSLEVAEQKGVYRQLVCSTTGEDIMPFEDNAFNVLVCDASITRLYNSPKNFPQWVRVVKPGGHVVVTLLRSNVELVETEENFYSQSLSQSLEENICDLQSSNKWKKISKEIFPQYLVNNNHTFDGLAMVFQVL